MRRECSGGSRLRRPEPPDTCLAIDIRTLALISGRLPARALGLVAEWGLLHQVELLSVWDSAKDLQPLRKIDPLP